MKRKILTLLLFFMLLCWGCASAPDIVSKETPEGETYSADEVRQVTVDQPFLLSGDYFREKKQEKTVDLGNLFSKNESGDSDSQKLKKAEIQEQPQTSPVPQRPVPQVPQPFPTKIGFILDHENMTRETAEQILRSMAKAAEAFPVAVADQDHIMEVLATTDCFEKKDLSCVSKAVGVYPGARMLALIELFEVPEHKPGSAKTRIEIVDTGLGFRYPLMEITAQVTNKADVHLFIAQVLRNIFDFAVRKSAVMPWFCRCFSREKDSWYISAGRISGLKPGDMLKVVSGGTVVRNPAGLPAGWIPGKQKGILKVEQLFGKDFAACSLTQGEGPNPDDMLLPAE